MSNLLFDLKLVLLGLLNHLLEVLLAHLLLIKECLLGSLQLLEILLGALLVLRDVSLRLLRGIINLFLPLAFLDLQVALELLLAHLSLLLVHLGVALSNLQLRLQVVELLVVR